MAKAKGPRVPGIVSYRPADDAAWVKVDEQSVPSRFYVETTVDYEWVDLGESDEEGEPVGAPEGRHRPYERITYVVEDGALEVEHYEVMRLPGLRVTDTRMRDRGLDEAGRRALERLAKGPGGPGFRRDLGLSTPGEERARRRALDSIRSGAVGRPGLTDTEVREAADVYLAAEAAGRRPTAAVRDELGLSRDQANRRVKRARDLGIIPEYRRGGRR